MAIVISTGFTWVNGNTVMPSRLNLAQTLSITLAADSLMGAIGAGAVAEIPCTATGRAMIAAVSVAAQRTLLALGGAALLAVGTTAGTVCAGDDSRLSDARQCNNTFASAATSRTALGLGGAALLAVGTTAGTVCAGDDSRLSDARQCNNTFTNAATSRTALGLGGSAVLAVGTTAGTVCAGDDSRLTNSRQCNNNFDSAATALTNLGMPAYLASPPTIGTTTPGNGRFVLLTVDSTLSVLAGMLTVDTSGATVGARLNLAAGTSAQASLRIPPGSGAISPSNGDIWTTTSALRVRLNGVSKITRFEDRTISTSAPSGTPADGDEWLQYTP